MWNRAVKEKVIPELVKTPVVIPDLEKESKHLAHIAASKLGYMAKSEIVERKKPGPLAFTLKALDINVYDEAKVSAYKTRIAKERTKEGEREDGYGISYSWEIAGISRFTGNIPDAVLQLACDISDRVSGVQFDVDYLQRNRVPTPDPFLVIRSGNERYYIAVWDEKDFERENA